MKKRKLNDLTIKKSTISNLQTTKLKGGVAPTRPVSWAGDRTCFDECQWSLFWCNTQDNC